MKNIKREDQNEITSLSMKLVERNDDVDFLMNEVNELTTAITESREKKKILEENIMKLTQELNNFKKTTHEQFSTVSMIN